MSLDDHEVVSAGLERMCRSADITWLGALDQLDHAVDQIAAAQPDVVLLDLYLGETEIWDTCRTLRQVLSNASLCLYSGYGNAVLLDRAMRHGANGYVLKSTPLSSIPTVIRALARGEEQWDPGLLSAWTARFRKSGEASVLTAHEIDIIALIAKGLDNYAIAGQLHLSSHTVKYHITQALRRTGEKNRAGLVRRAHAEHLLPM